MKRNKPRKPPAEAANGRGRTPSPSDADPFNAIARQRIAIPDRQAVVEYLNLHPDLRELLTDIAAKTRRLFGPDVELSLEIYKDPEIDDRYLALYVRHDHYGPEILQRIEKVNRAFDDRLEKASGYFAVTTDFHRRTVAHGV